MRVKIVGACDACFIETIRSLKWLELLEDLSVMEPDIYVIDIALQDLDGLELCRRIMHVSRQQANVLLLLNPLIAVKYHNPIARCPFRGLLLNTSKIDIVEEAIRKVGQGSTYKDPSIDRLTEGRTAL